MFDFCEFLVSRVLNMKLELLKRIRDRLLTLTTNPIKILAKKDSITFDITGIITFWVNVLPF